MTTERSSADRATRSKVKRLTDEYDLSEVGDRLERLWTGEDDVQMSLRELADYFNRELLETAMVAAGMDLLDGDVENVYRLLTADDVSSGNRVQARNRLENHGVDVDRLEEDFVSRQAIHTYLTSYRGVNYSDDADSSEDRIGRRRETIQRIRNRLATISEDTLENLASDADFVAGEPDVLVNVRVHCPDCNVHTDIDDLLANGGCNCNADGD